MPWQKLDFFNPLYNGAPHGNEAKITNSAYSLTRWQYKYYRGRRGVHQRPRHRHCAEPETQQAGYEFLQSAGYKIGETKRTREEGRRGCDASG
jgi:hypothetical protein